eukprot:354903-Chlamydomonas_euryale.AAC.28
MEGSEGSCKQQVATRGGRRKRKEGQQQHRPPTAQTDQRKPSRRTCQRLLLDAMLHWAHTK